MNNKIENERLFHNQRFESDDQERAKVSKYYCINKLLDQYYNNKILETCKGADLLEYGCATGVTAFEWMKYGAKVTGIDISDEGIKKAKDRAKYEGTDIQFFQMDAENMYQFNSESFDIVTGKGILHHLDLEKAYSEIARVMRKNGRAIFIEPLGHNIIINLYRKFTPSLRTQDEHPLILSDLDKAKKYFGQVRIKYFHITTLSAVPFRHYFFFNVLLQFLNMFDTKLMSIFPSVKKYAWIVVIELYNPL